MKDSNPQPADLESAALPIEPIACKVLRTAIIYLILIFASTFCKINKIFGFILGGFDVKIFSFGKIP